MCKSNYDIVLAGANDGVCGGAGFACIVVRWLDCELKRPTMFKKPCLKDKYVQQQTESEVRLCKQTCWATFWFRSFVPTKCSLYECVQKCLQKSKAAKSKAKSLWRHQKFFTFGGQIAKPSILWWQNARFSELKHANLCNKSLLELQRTFALERASALNQAFCGHRMRDSRMHAKLF